jgi:signal peptidase I
MNPIEQVSPPPEPAQTEQPAGPTIKGKPAKPFWREVLETVLLTVGLYLIVQSMIQPVRVENISMQPTLYEGQQLIVNKAAYFHFDINPWLRLLPWVKADGQHYMWLFGGPKRGDTVVFKYPLNPSEDYVKRIIGLPGDKVEVRGGLVYVNDKALTEPYIKEAPLANYGPRVVPPDSFFVMGDNRNNSSDSRSWGFVPTDDLIGAALFRYWPFGNGWGFLITPTP